MSKWAYTRGLHDLGNAVYAYLQPDGSWGWSNAGIIVDSGVSLLVDTLYDLKLTREMLTTMRNALPDSAQIDMLVNTHANGDHCYGNQLVGEARIIASTRTAEEMLILPPQLMAVLKQQAAFLGPVGAFASRIYAPFDFEDIILTPPNQTFEKELEVQVGTKTVQLLEVGPAHTRGDTLVYIPDDRVIFTGDILFNEGHPIAWEGPISNWIRACDRILALNVDTVVPGHGPITDKTGVIRLKEYFLYLQQEVKQRYEAGMTVLQAARDISLDAYAGWSDPERLIVNVDTLYREFAGEQEVPSNLTLFGLMVDFLQSESESGQEPERA